MSLTSFFTGAPAKFKVTFADADTRQTVTTKVNEKDVEQYLFSASDNVCGTVRPAPSLPQRRSAAADRETVCGAPGGHRGHRWEEDGAHGHQDRAHRPHRCALLPPGPSTVHLGSCDRAWPAPSRLFTAPPPPPLPHPASALACLSQSCSTTAATRSSSPRWCALACSRRALPLSARPLDSHTRSIGGRPKHMHTRPGARAGDAWRPRRLEELPLRVHRRREAAYAACDTSVVRGRRACAAVASSEGRVPARGCGSLAATAWALRDVPCHIPPARAAGTSPTRASTYGCGARDFEPRA